MTHWIAPHRPRLHRIAVLATVLITAVVMATEVAAQTLTDPTPQTRSAPPPPSAAKTEPTARGNTCSQYGAGFVYIPATGACLKIGGFVTVEGTGR